MDKDFDGWIKLKKKIDINSIGPLFFKEGDVWWTAIGENIGVEINGKSEVFSRPVLVYKKLSKLGCMIVPFSTKIKKGTWYSNISFLGKNCIAHLAQARVISSARLYEKLGTLDEKQYKKVKDDFHRLYS
jgi:mRNA-degrading endonuclease toxin of MazEF toxin-antitoxin module